MLPRSFTFHRSARKPRTDRFHAPGRAYSLRMDLMYWVVRTTYSSSSSRISTMSIGWNDLFALSVIPVARFACWIGCVQVQREYNQYKIFWGICWPQNLSTPTTATRRWSHSHFETDTGTIAIMTIATFTTTMGTFKAELYTQQMPITW